MVPYRPVRVNRRRFLGASAAALAGCAGSQPEAPAISSERRTPLDGPLPEGNKLNLIVVCADTSRVDHLGPYGSTRVRTPSLDAFAQQAALFENSYAEALPTLPCRRVFFTGRGYLHEKEGWWRALRDDDVTLSQVLKKAGYTTGLITDIFHYFKPGMNFHQSFDSFEFIRGQEADLYIAGPREEFDPREHMPPHHHSQQYLDGIRQYMMNTQSFDRDNEDDYFAARVFKAGMDWLERCAKQSPFFLWIDSFDPHEPWDPPKRYAEMYRTEWPYERYLFGYPIDPNREVRREDYPYIRDLYAGEVTYMDAWFGRFFEKVEELGLLDDTIVVFLSDHGTHLGEFDCVQKTPGLPDSRLANLPLILRHPDAARYGGKRASGYISAVDYMPTLLSLLGMDGLPGMDGQDVWPKVEDSALELRDRVFFGYGDFGAVRTRDWLYFQNWRGDDRGKGPALFDLAADPDETRNVVADHPRVVDELRGLLAERFQTDLPPAEG